MPVLTRFPDFQSRIPGFRHHRNSVEGNSPRRRNRLRPRCHSARAPRATIAHRPCHGRLPCGHRYPRSPQFNLDHAHQPRPGIWQLVHQFRSPSLCFHVQSDRLAAFRRRRARPRSISRRAQRTRHLQWQPDGEFSSPQLAGSLQVDNFDITSLPPRRLIRLKRTGILSPLRSQLSFHAIAFARRTLRRDETSL